MFIPPPQRPSRLRRVRRLVVALVLTLLAVGCRVDGDDMAVDLADGVAAPAGPTTANDEPGQDGAPSTEAAPAPQSPPAASDLPRSLSVADLDCTDAGTSSTTGLNDAGRAMFQRHVDSQAAVPSYELAVDIDPTSGSVAGAMRATIPMQTRTLDFRVFAGMEAFESGLEITNVTVDGEAVSPTLDRALLRIPAPTSAGDVATVELDFRYTIAQLAANENLLGGLSGESLQPDQVGLLGRTESGMQLGHWFPVWLPDGSRDDPDPDGFGDIGAFPSADICATITVPQGFDVITGGVRVGTTESSVIEAGAGLRDFSILVSDDLALTSAVVDGVELRVWGPKADPQASQTVLDFAVQSQTALVDAFGPYPWTEVDLVSAPLGGGVGGMEWPGMIWVERSMFAGGLPGLGGFDELFGDSDFDFESILGSFGGEALATTLEWTIAHELGHEWWHATVGNDSIESPAVDEPLAQFSACVAMQVIHPENWRAICDAQTTEQYAQARGLGVADAPAEQASDRFDSSLQYGAVIYGKAPGFYFATADLIGWDPLIDALRTFVAENSFALVGTDALRTHLIEAAGSDGAAVGDLWDRWFREARGDEDIEPVDLFGSLGGFGELDGFDLEGLDLEGLDLGELFGEDSELFEQLLEDFLTPPDD